MSMSKRQCRLPPKRFPTTTAAKDPLVHRNTYKHKDHKNLLKSSRGMHNFKYNWFCFILAYIEYFLITKRNISITNLWNYLNIWIYSHNHYINSEMTLYVVVYLMAINYFSSQLMSPTMELAFAVGCLRQFRGDSLWSRCHSHSVFVSRFVNSTLQTSNLYRLFCSLALELIGIILYILGCTRVREGCHFQTWTPSSWGLKRTR